MEGRPSSTYARSPQGQGYESNNPFTSSVTQRILNSRIPRQNMDQVLLPSPSPIHLDSQGVWYYDDTTLAPQPAPTEGLYNPRRYGHLDGRPIPTGATNRHDSRSSRRHRTFPSSSSSSHSRSRSPSPRPSGPYGIPTVFPRPPSPSRPTHDFPAPGLSPYLPSIPDPTTLPYIPGNAPYTSPWSQPDHALKPCMNPPHSFHKGAPLGTYITTVIVTLPRGVYSLCLFHLPPFYFSRIDQIFKDADLSMGQIKEMALRVTAENRGRFQSSLLMLGPYSRGPEVSSLPQGYKALKENWEAFIDTLIKEWETLNIVSVLLLAAILTVFQIQGAGNDPVTRYLAFWSLVCALVSLLYGCVFIIRFGTMRKTYKAAEWALEARNSQTVIWNGWVMLAMPAVWLTWSIIAFTTCIMSFMWRASANLPSGFAAAIPPSTELGCRILICVVLGVGVGYGVLILDTFHRYGTKMDEAWKHRVEQFLVAYPPPRCRDVPPPTNSGSRWLRPESPPGVILQPQPQVYPIHRPGSSSRSRSREKLPHTRHPAPIPPDPKKGQHVPNIVAPGFAPPIAGALSHRQGHQDQPLAPADITGEGRGRKRSVSRDWRGSRPPSNHTRTVSQAHQVSPSIPLRMPDPPKDPWQSWRTRLEVPRKQGSKQASPERHPTHPGTLPDKLITQSPEKTTEPSRRDTREVEGGKALRDKDQYAKGGRE